MPDSQTREWAKRIGAERLQIEPLDLMSTTQLLVELEKMVQALDAFRSLFDRGLEGSHSSPMASRIHRELVHIARLSVDAGTGQNERWLKEHVPLFDVLDSLYDCQSSECPRTGFHSAESRAFHYAMWERYDRINTTSRR